MTRLEGIDPVPLAAVQAAIQSRRRPPWTVLAVGGELDAVGAPALRQAVVAAVSTGGTSLILDLTGVDFIDSFGVGAVVGALKRVRQRGGELALVCPVPRVRRVLELCDLDRILTLHDSLDAVGASDDGCPTDTVGALDGSRPADAVGAPDGNRPADARP